MPESRRWNKLFVSGIFVLLVLWGSSVPRTLAQEQVVLTSGKLEYPRYGVPEAACIFSHWSISLVG